MPDDGHKAEICSVITERRGFTIDAQFCLLLSVHYLVLITEWDGCTQD